MKYSELMQQALEHAKDRNIDIVEVGMVQEVNRGLLHRGISESRKERLEMLGEYYCRIILGKS